MGLFRSFRAWIVGLSRVPGRCPGLWYGAPSGLGDANAVSPNGAIQEKQSSQGLGSPVGGSGTRVGAFWWQGLDESAGSRSPAEAGCEGGLAPGRGPRTEARVCRWCRLKPGRDGTVTRLCPLGVAGKTLTGMFATEIRPHPGRGGSGRRPRPTTPRETCSRPPQRPHQRPQKPAWKRGKDSQKAAPVLGNKEPLALLLPEAVVSLLSLGLLKEGRSAPETAGSGEGPSARSWHLLLYWRWSDQ